MGLFRASSETRPHQQPPAPEDRPEEIPRWLKLDVETVLMDKGEAGLTADEVFSEIEKRRYGVEMPGRRLVERALAEVGDEREGGRWYQKEVSMVM